VRLRGVHQKILPLFAPASGLERGFFSIEKPMKNPTLTLCILLGALLGLAAKSKTTLPVLSAPNHVYLRNTFDADPSSYIGRFVKDDAQAAQIDEAATFKSRCSVFIKQKFVPGGNVLVEEMFNASTNAGATAGLGAAGMKIANFGFELATSNVVRVKYTSTGKMQSDIPDPGAFEDCCKAAPDQCSKRYIGEFVQGTGAIYLGAAKGGKVDVGIEQGLPVPGLDTMVYPEIEFGRSVSWFRGTVFTTPVYFAFKLSETGENWDNSVCESDWVNSPPVSVQGQYVVGVSALAPSETTARDLAMANAREQVVRFVGEQLAMGTITVSEVAGTGATVSTALQSETTVQRVAAGMASFVKDRCWKLETVDQVDGRFYLAKVLAFIPNASVEQAARALTESVKTP
jgi:hypothetical protein